MGSFVGILYFAAGAAVLVVVWLVLRTVRSLMKSQERKWRERGGGDRRQRTIPVKNDRRRRIRRHEDQARAYVKSLQDRLR